MFSQIIFIMILVFLGSKKKFWVKMTLKRQVTTFLLCIVHIKPVVCSFSEYFNQLFNKTINQSIKWILRDVFYTIFIMELIISGVKI